jgi:hypothetical protein
MIALVIELITLSASPFTAANPSHYADTGKPVTELPASVSRAAFNKIIVGIVVCIWLVFMDVLIFIHIDVLHYIQSQNENPCFGLLAAEFMDIFIS